MAKHIRIGESAHDAERQAIRILVEGLPDAYTVYSNAWLVERSGVVHELDAVVVAPHGLYVVEAKSFRGTVLCLDHDWYVPEPIPSPLKLNRKTAQVLATELRRHSYEAGRRWVEHFVFLSHAAEIDLKGSANRGRVHGRATILAALQDAKGFAERAARGRPPPVDAHTSSKIHELLMGANPKLRPSRRIREYELVETLERTDRYVEHLAEHRLSRARSVLRVYPFEPFANEADRRRVEERCRWEAQVLARIGQCKNILSADPPFLDEAGICLPLKFFAGVSLGAWVERHHKSLVGLEGLKERVRLFEEIAEAVEQAHRHGVVHRLLRPEVVLVQDQAREAQVRVTGFDLAKQLHSDETVAITTLHDERTRWAAPEVVRGFSNATPLSDQFGLGALLGLLLGGKPLFDSTADLLRLDGRTARLRDLNPAVPQSFDHAVARMLSLRPTDRFPTLAEARNAVAQALEGRGPPPAPKPLDPDAMPKGTRLGSDYEIVDLLGAGGMATVYAALHLVSGHTRALKVARAEPRAREVLHAEYMALKGMREDRQRPRTIVEVIDVFSGLVEGRLTMVMERVKGEPLSKWISAHPTPDRATLRRFAEDLLQALAYLHERGYTHKDIKPDNLVVGDEGLTLIDFSLINEPSDSIFVGTARYRDPSLKVWDAASDRYSAALCLFELYSGRHAFDGQAPGPGDKPRIDETDFDQKALVGFFETALNPNREARFHSAAAMRAALLEALGVKDEPQQGELAAPGASSTDPSIPLSATALSEPAVAALRRAGVNTQGELVALQPSQIDAISGLGKKKRREVFDLQANLVRRGVLPSAVKVPARRSLWPSLEGDPTDLHRLGLPPSLCESLVSQGLTTVGRLAASTRDDLKALQGVGSAKRVGQIVEALQGWQERGSKASQPATLQQMWSVASAPLVAHQESIVADSFGIRGDLQTQERIGARLQLSQSEVSSQLQKGLDRLDRRALDPIFEHVRAELEVLGGVRRLDEVAGTVEERWPGSEEAQAAGLVRLVARLNETQFNLVDHPGQEGCSLVLAPGIDQKAIESFICTARRVAKWPPTEPEAARKSLRALLPEYQHDPLMLATRLLIDLKLTDAGELFEAPIKASEAIGYVLSRQRLPMSLDSLWAEIQRNFGEAALLPEREHLASLVAEKGGWRLDGDQIVSAGGRSIAATRPEQDGLPPELMLATKSPEAVAGDLLRAAAKSRGYRLVVTPPEVHAEVGRSVARALGVPFVSFEQELLARMEPAFESFERAERFKAQRPKLKAEAEALLRGLITRYGRSGAVTVIGDTAVLGLCEAGHLAQALYAEASAVDLGFWCLVVPGVVQKRQPLLNEKFPLFHLDGHVLPLRAEVP